MDEYVKKLSYILQNIYQLYKKRNLAICYNTDETWGHYAKWNKSAEKDKYCIASIIFGICGGEIPS